MKKEAIVCLIFLIFIFGIVIVHSQTNDNSLDGNNSMKVVINIKEPAKEKGFIFKTEKTPEEIAQEKIETKEKIIEQVGEEDVNHIFDDRIAVDISKEELERLKSNPNIESITQDRPIIAFLPDSVPLVNATRTWPLQYNGLNLTGIDETICIIDTGVNFTHPDLVGRNKTCVIDCVSKSCRENCSINDDNGHGTHVAGTAGANGLLKGVAIGAKIIGVKVLNSAGSGSGSDLDAGIDWCIANANAYNISVISMSLGTACKYSNGTATGWCYDYYCDNVPSEESAAIRINNATSRNISVIAAAGNDANFTHISSPACVKNATAVGASDKSDNIATSYSNRNNLTDLFAPGSSINSTRGYSGCVSGCSCSGNYMVCSGTSMATPHVAGAFAIIRQYFKLQNGRVPTPSEIQNILNSTGKIIIDSQAGLNFSRINIYAAILSLDNTAPNVTLISPTNNTANITVNQTFYCNASDFQLKNITLYLWNSSNNLIYNETQNISGVSNSSSFNVSNLGYDNYKWNCQAFDINNYSAFANSNFSLTITNLVVSLNSPINSLNTNQNQSYNCSFVVNSSSILANSTFYVWNSSNSLVYNETQNISGTSNSSIYNYNFSSEGNFSWNCRIFDNNSNSGFGESNYSIRYDATSPVINSLTSSVTTTSAVISWNNSENTNFSLIYGTSSSNLNLNYSDTNFSSSNSTTLSALSSSTTYYYNITFCDITGNCVLNGTNSFTTSTRIVESSSSGGGGGGGGSSSNTYSPKSEEISAGYTQQLNKNDKILFSILNENKITGGNHSLTISEIKNNKVTITIRSNPINITLEVGESRKLNLSSPIYYDLYIKLEEIISNKARITIKAIHENIAQKQISNSDEKTLNETDGHGKLMINEDNSAKSLVNIQALILTIITFVIILIICIITSFTLYKMKLYFYKKEKIKKLRKDYIL